MRKPVINVLVPTRDRADTLVHCLKTLVNQRYDALRIIVSDNCGTDQTSEVVHSFADSRITYIRTHTRVSMSKNWEFALSHATSGWVTFLGDDDGLLPNACELLAPVLAECGVDAVNCRASSFVWPGHFAAPKDGLLKISLLTSSKVYDARNRLSEVLGGSLDYSHLPWLYHGGLVTTSLIDRCRKADGTFFNSQIPDLYSAIAISLSTGNYLHTNQPFAINGASSHSTGTSLMMGSASSKTSPSAAFNNEPNIPFHRSLLLGKSLQVMLYESYLQASHLRRGTDLTSIDAQLAIAAAVAPSFARAAVRLECERIALLNGITFRHKTPLGVILRRVKDGAIQLFFSVWVCPISNGLRTIADAALFSDQLRREIALGGVAKRLRFLLQTVSLVVKSRLARAAKAAS